MHFSSIIVPLAFGAAMGLLFPEAPRAQTAEPLTVEIGHVSQGSYGGVDITVTLTSNDTRSHAWVHVGCVLLDDKGAPVETGATSITNVQPNSKNYGTVTFVGRAPWKTQTCRVEDASRSEAR